jgi:hypothetical protein
MPAGLPIALVMLAQATSAAAPADAPKPLYGPAVPVAAKPAPPPVKAAARECPTVVPDGKTREIVICAEKPLGYRLNPDVMKAKREVHSAGRPTRPGPIAMKDNSCTVVGAAPCIGAPMINLLAAAVTLATMADRLSKGQEIGSMFVTDPHPTEYQLYVEAKREREAKEAAKAAAAKAQAAAAEQSQQPAKPAQ